MDMRLGHSHNSSILDEASGRSGTVCTDPTRAEGASKMTERQSVPAPNVGDVAQRGPTVTPSDGPAYRLRQATVADARTIAEYRRLMFTAMGDVVAGRDDDMVPAMERYVERELPAGRLVGW